MLTLNRAATLSKGDNVDRTEPEPLVDVLREIRDAQAEQLAIQRQHLEIAKTQYDRANAINDRAEQIQAKSDALIERSRSVFKVVIPILAVLIVGAAWLLFTLF